MIGAVIFVGFVLMLAALAVGAVGEVWGWDTLRASFAPFTDEERAAERSWDEPPSAEESA